MGQIKLKVDWYTKVVLTVIALTLCWLSVNPFFTAKEVSANPGVVDVNIAEIDGLGIVHEGTIKAALPVRIIE